MKSLLIEEKLQEYSMLAMEEVVKIIRGNMNQETSYKEVKKELKKFIENKK